MVFATLYVIVRQSFKSVWVDQSAVTTTEVPNVE